MDLEGKMLVLMFWPINNQTANTMRRSSLVSRVLFLPAAAAAVATAEASAIT